jgi:hypothetical protein
MARTIKQQFDHARAIRAHYGSHGSQAGSIINYRGVRFVVVDAEHNDTARDVWHSGWPSRFTPNSDTTIASMYILRRVNGSRHYIAYQSLDGYITVPRTAN